MSLIGEELTDMLFSTVGFEVTQVQWMDRIKIKGQLPTYFKLTEVVVLDALKLLFLILGKQPLLSAFVIITTPSPPSPSSTVRH